jgi:hypothetical protein
MIYAYPGLIGAGLWVANIFRQEKSRSGHRVAQFFLICFAIFCVFKESRFSSQVMRHVDYTTAKKLQWRDCYRRIEDIAQCDALTAWKIYPVPDATRLSEKLNFLKSRSGNLFKSGEDNQ